MKYLIIFISFFYLSSYSIELDSLIQISQSKVEYSKKFDSYEQLSSYYLRQDIDSAKFFVKQFVRLGETHNDAKFLSRAYGFNAKILLRQAKFSEAIEYYKRVEKICIAEKDSSLQSEILKFIGQAYNQNGESAQAVKYYLRSSELKEKIGDYKGMSSIYNGIGSLYYNEENSNEALVYYKKSLVIADSVDFKIAICILNMNIGNIYADIDTAGLSKTNNNIDSLLEAKSNAKGYYEKSLVIATELGDKARMALVYSNLGSVDSSNTIKYFKKSLALKEEIGDIQGQWYDLNNIAKYYYERKKLKFAETYSLKAIELAQKEKLKKQLVKSYLQFATIESDLRKHASAYSNLMAYSNLKDTLDRKRTTSEFSKLEKKWNYEKREKENELLKTGNDLLKKNEELNEERIAKKNIYLWASGAGFLLFGFLIFFILKGYRQKQKANQLLNQQNEQIEEANEELNQQNEEIVAQRDEIEAQRDIVLEQKEEIEEIHQEVSQSIDYAERLQGAILPKQDILKKDLGDFFVLFMPKDKVSGDYYWWSKVDDQLVITAADCTGHGVPGAFMSMLGVSFLKEIVNKEYITQPALILKKMRREIIKTLGQKGVAGEQKDGMDMALLSINKSGHVQFSGANNPLYIVSKNDFTEQVPDAKVFNEGGDATLFDLKPDKMPISIYERMDNFTNVDLQLQKGEMLYMFSDGYADQFGGPKGKKFKYKPFKRLILENCHKPMKEQEAILKNAFENWRGDEEQVDDVVIIGLKI